MKRAPGSQGSAGPHDLLTLDEWESLDIGEGHHVECVEGVLIVAPRPHARHQRTLTQLASGLDSQLPLELTTVAGVELLLLEALTRR